MSTNYFSLGENRKRHESTQHLHAHDLRWDTHAAKEAMKKTHNLCTPLTYITDLFYTSYLKIYLFY